MSYLKWSFFLLVMFVSELAFAQQLPLFSQYRENHALLNPAVTHADYVALSYKPNNTIGLSYRYQWQGIRDAPKTFTARYERIFNKENFILGGGFMKDQTGPTGFTGGYLRYAYMLRFSRTNFLTLGTNLHFQQFRFQSSRGVLTDLGDDLGMSDLSNFQGNASIGAYYQSEFPSTVDIFYTGLSILQLGTVHFSSNDFKPTNTPHFYFLGGIYKYLGDGFGNLEGELFIEPSIWVKYVPNTPIQLDANFRFQMAGLFWIGTGYSVAFANYETIDGALKGNNFVFEFGITLGESLGFDYSQMKIGYSYGRSITTYGPDLGNIHELNLTYSWKD